MKDNIYPSPRVNSLGRPGEERGRDSLWLFPAFAWATENEKERKRKKKEGENPNAKDKKARYVHRDIAAPTRFSTRPIRRN